MVIFEWWDCGWFLFPYLCLFFLNFLQWPCIVLIIKKGKKTCLRAKSLGNRPYFLELISLRISFPLVKKQGHFSGGQKKGCNFFSAYLNNNMLIKESLENRKSMRKEMTHQPEDTNVFISSFWFFSRFHYVHLNTWLFSLNILKTLIHFETLTFKSIVNVCLSSR